MSDLFKVGDVVWCLCNGRGTVVCVGDDDMILPVKISFDNGSVRSYTKSGGMLPNVNRVLFFSEPKIEAELFRKFEPKLIGKKVLVTMLDKHLHVGTVLNETADVIDFIDVRYSKTKGIQVFEVGSENLL